MPFVKLCALCGSVVKFDLKFTTGHNEHKSYTETINLQL